MESCNGLCPEGRLHYNRKAVTVTLPDFVKFNIKKIILQKNIQSYCKTFLTPFLLLLWIIDIWFRKFKHTESNVRNEIAFLIMIIIDISCDYLVFFCFFFKNTDIPDYESVREEEKRKWLMELGEPNFLFLLTFYLNLGIKLKNSK